MLIIHHWDTDGIVSAVLAIKALNLEDFINITPPIGEFRFDNRIWKEIEKAEKIYVLDLNLPQEVENIEKETIFIDHHIQKRIKNPYVKQINPVLDGRDFPSASFVVSEYFSLWNYLSALGAVGDIGERAFSIKKVLELLNEKDISKEEALKLVQLIDSNYIVMERESVEKSVNVILELEPKELLEYEKWNKNVEMINNAIEDAISNIKVKDNIAFIEFESKFNIISKVARKVVWEMSYDGAIVVNKNFNGKGQIYFRISSNLVDKIKMNEIINTLKSKGFNAGGKKDVLGCICDKKEIDEVLNVIKKYKC
ncbi:phosphoesterase RecJ domain protein [Methanocaldococcus vulcanius M7]|uniref:Phosphoesterase RecJ domain protein n=1 Tax=Methanocaldococcus vulcanius (strain ATCC 700851 / DSM 12094 / M7) TaxID=579137 RepID=C9RED0_METVM|nr:DHH family phosphoesterase [Methanocaldococcus vulcanius]ACX71932.1 phosphoesterase RecJ domain protein [Methanocaldococcus vulcanius M7]